MADPGLLTGWSRLLLRSLAEVGITQVVLSPGSRSTPFVAAAVHAGLTLHDITDERAAGFFALGQARVTGRPSLLLCTSGTAPAHYYPALLEAEAAHLPMVVLSADRPLALVGCGAPQTIDQSHLYGHHVRGAFELGGPDESPVGLRSLRRIAAQAYALSLGPVPGPVHLNARADKPLEVIEPGPSLAATLAEVTARPPTRIHPGRRGPDPAGLAALGERLRVAQRPLVALGPGPLGLERHHPALRAELDARGLVTYAELASQHRSGGVGDLFNIVHSIDRPELAPDLVLELGGPPTSGAWAKMIERVRPERVVVQPYGHGDPHQDAALLLEAEPLAVVQALPTPEAAADYRDRFAAAEAEARAALTKVLAEAGTSELGVVQVLLEAAPAGTLWILGNSLAVRHVDLLPAPPWPISALAQRGVSGIDGLVAGAAGAGSQTDRPILLLLGDVSLLHDLSSLGLLPRPAPTVVVVLNNDGGHIFDQLPIARTPEWPALARHFTTPHGRHFDGAAAMFGLGYQRVARVDEVRASLAQAFQTRGPTLIEVVVPPEGAIGVLERLTSAVKGARREGG